MTPKIKTRDVTKSVYSNYLKKAEECFHAAQTSFDNQEWNAAAIKCSDRPRSSTQTCSSVIFPIS